MEQIQAHYYVQSVLIKQLFIQSTLLINRQNTLYLMQRISLETEYSLVCYGLLDKRQLGLLPYQRILLSLKFLRAKSHTYNFSGYNGTQYLNWLTKRLNMKMSKVQHKLIPQLMRDTQAVILLLQHSILPLHHKQSADFLLNGMLLHLLENAITLTQLIIPSEFDLTNTSTPFHTGSITEHWLFYTMKEIEHTIVKENTGLIKSIVSANTKNKLAEQDYLQQHGTIGLIRAVNRYKPIMGFRFSTYAVWWIAERIQNYLSVQNVISRSSTGQTVPTVSLNKQYSIKDSRTLSDLIKSDTVVSKGHVLDKIIHQNPLEEQSVKKACLFWLKKGYFPYNAHNTRDISNLLLIRMDRIRLINRQLKEIVKIKKIKL